MLSSTRDVITALMTEYLLKPSTSELSEQTDQLQRNSLPGFVLQFQG